MSFAPDLTSEIETCNTKLIEHRGYIKQWLQRQKVELIGTDERPRVGALAGVNRRLIGPLLRATFNVSVHGTHRIPLTGPAIISANHRSFFDSPLLMVTTPKPVFFLGKAEYMDSNWTKFLFPAVGMVPIRRQQRRAAAAALDTAAALLEAGHWVGIYPEGTRSRDGMLHHGKAGVAQLSLLTGAPIIPVGLVGTDKAQPIGARFPLPFRGQIRVEFGDAIDPARYQYGSDRKRRQHILADVMRQIATMTEQPRAPDFEVHDNPLMWGGTESVYRVTGHGAIGLSWRHAADRLIDAISRPGTDARVGQVERLRCRVQADGDLQFEIGLSISSRIRSLDNHQPARQPGSTPEIEQQETS